ncbi:RNA 2',3'-cyclic phosphodiesterase [Blastomonas sp. AAP53]|uniref:RNA 2',3'-cyclic phosphodiesterase n=1 Tax=Blastomonas sp. AAP53 TaxID=1248760 RepID=UPI0003173EE2|nr:RNA 2',3'-cyclic phosphodiesterase [Blastomonas sp. AAP53]
MRLFLALVPPPAIRACLIERMHGLAGARWQSEAPLHVTLRFIGDADRHQAESLLLALRAERFARFETRLDGFGWFDRRGRVDQLWTGLAPRDPLAALHARLDRLCVSCGFEPEGRRYMPHITLARFARSLAPDPAQAAAWIAAQPPLPGTAFTFDELALVESHMGRDGSVYETVAGFAMHG